MQQTLTQIKVIVVGDSGVGKSSILFRFVNDEFNEFSQATLGAAFVSKVHSYDENQNIRFQIWDTAGQQKYKSIAPIYYRQSQVALCVYDITKPQSFIVLKNWVDQLISKGPQNLQLVVVGNKIDRSEDQKVGYHQAKQYAQQMGAMFKLTSAKQGKGINQVFDAVARKLEQRKIAMQRKGNKLQNKDNGDDKPKCKC